MAKVRKLKLIHQKHPKEQQIVPPKLLSYLQPYNAVIFINYGKGCSVITMQRYFACIWSTTSGTRELTYSITPTVRSVCLTSVCLVCQSLEIWLKLLLVNTVTGRAYIGTRVNLHSGCTCAQVSSWHISTRVVTPRISIPRFVYV